MRKISLLILLFIGLTVYSQDDASQQEAPSRWKRNGIASLQLNQASFNNWSAGGENSYAFLALMKYYADYAHENFSVDNNLNLKYGLQSVGKNALRKNEDLIEWNTKINQKFSKKWSASGLINFTSQFANGYNYPDDSTVISKFLAPAYLTIAPGILYKPVDYFSILFTPASLRAIFVTDQELADLGAFGVDPAEFNEQGAKVTDGKNSKIKLGAFAEFYLKKNVKTDLDLESKLNFFYNYLPDNALPSGKIPLDINWQNFVNYRISKWFSTTFFIHLAYMPTDIRIESIPPPSGIGGNELKVTPNNKVQLKQTFGIGIAYNF
ncbi:MAG: DUF3078 domain-containing protein [Bacteroidales bacterium]|jgi:hypothetical protein|nr:DUF3078 domain-containing protein [Bacteroidales bacterium]MDI9591637.1 DUF3078 domain-containing protein [Bacteroidota bacterium]NLH33752.1 DUF3078 domain-containing protein [Lentimicrobium sp.]OQC38575.1 MAG: hypothetical protein BWX63_00212 [Bacteroidetes bacterium ADurb.Bin041]MBP7874880.1 DUF3078 domain-containing protein [Bacteroidales bacterium]